ncbi:endonuclease domain-containing 1 protein-like [Salvelinus alpinus]
MENFSDVTDCEKFFLEGTTPNLPGILVNGTVQNQGQNQNRYKPICQNYKNIYRFATLYDTTNRIPVFSAYNFTGPDPGIKDEVCKLSRSWRMEKQLKNKNEPNRKHQAANADYSNNSLGLERGHLFPCSYAPDNATKSSTFTLTNAVPQYSSFNKGSWKTMEGRVREALLNNCKNNNKKIKAYVVTGAVPSNNNKLKERVNIPDLLWTAFCCYNSEKDKWVAEAHWGENKKKELNTEVLEPHNLTDLYVMLNNHYRVDGVVGVDGVKVFPEKCSKGDIPTELLENIKYRPKKRKLDADDDGGDVQLNPNKRLKGDTPRALLLKVGGG